MVTIEEALARWHRFVTGDADVEDVLAPHCTFYSPVVFTPQEGSDLTAMYLNAARTVFFSGDAGFSYRTEVASGRNAILEFEATLGDTYINGVDILTFDDDGYITEFKVMLRPVQAVNLMHDLMRAQISGS